MAAQSQGAIAPTVFQFQESTQLRVVTIDGELWFVAIDVCAAIDVQNVTQAVARLDDDERSMFNIGRQGDTTIVNESGLYSLILTSRKPEAKKFKKWVTSEVLPAIRKTGNYQIPAAKQYATETISNAQYHELKHLVYMISRNFHREGGGSFAAWKVLRQELACEVAAKLPAENYDAAKARLEQIQIQAFAFKCTILKAEDQFFKSLFQAEPDWVTLEQDARRLGVE